MQQKSMLEILNETVQYYSEDVTRRGTNRTTGSCEYLTEEGCMCAVGRCMSKPSRDMIGSATMLTIGVSCSDLEKELKPEYRGHPISFWRDIQTLHDKDANWSVASGLTTYGEFRVAQIKQMHNL
jgi:hypothetical protein